jgi:hypothetical protein
VSKSNSTIRGLTAISLIALVAGAAFGQAPPPAPAGPDTPGTGRYPSMKEEDPSLADHTVYRPADLAAMGKQKLGVVAWGNGGCSDDAASTRFHLLELASHGYLVIASGKILSGPGAPPRPVPAALPGGGAWVALARLPLPVSRASCHRPRPPPRSSRRPSIGH